MGLLNPPRQRSQSGNIALLLIVLAIVIVVAVVNVVRDITAPKDERENAQAAQPAPSATATATETPRPTHNWIIDTVHVGQLQVIEQQKRNLELEAALMVEESNQRQRHAEQLLSDRRTQEAISASYAYTSTQQADMMSMSVQATAIADDRNAVATWNQLGMIIVTVSTAIIAAIIVVFAKSYYDDRRYAREYEPEPVEPEIIEIHQDGNIRRPLAGLDTTTGEIEIIAGVVQSATGLTVRAIVDAGITRDRWMNIRQDMLDRGLLELKRYDAERIRVIPTAEGWAVFNEYAPPTPPSQPTP